MKEGLYREAALKQLAMSERFDTAVPVVSAATSLVVLAAFALIATAVAWAFVGRVPSRVYGEGLLLRRGSIVDVTSMADGQVQRVLVSVGDVVKENAPIAYVDQPELAKQRSLLQGKLEELNQKFTQMAGLDLEGDALKRAVLSQQRDGVHFALRETKKQLAFYQQKLEADNRLLDEGLVTPAAVAETRQKVLELSDAIHARQAEGESIAFNALETRRTLTERKFALSMEVSQTQRELEELEKRIDTQSVVLSKSAGRVIEIKTSEGDAVVRGRAIAMMEVTPSQEEDLVAEVYVPAQDGKRVKVGMPIKLAPAVVKPEEDGYLEGTVDAVSPFPASEESILRAVRNADVVRALVKDGPVYEVHVRVGRDPGSPSGLRWSNGRGPQIHIASGTPVHGLVTVRTRRPIDFVVPALRRMTSDAPSDATDGTER